MASITSAVLYIHPPPPTVTRGCPSPVETVEWTGKIWKNVGAGGREELRKLDFHPLPYSNEVVPHLSGIWSKEEVTFHRETCGWNSWLLLSLLYFPQLSLWARLWLHPPFPTALMRQTLWDSTLSSILALLKWGSACPHANPNWGDSGVKLYHLHNTNEGN